MYTMTSLLSAIFAVIPLMLILWLNFRWNHQYGSLKWLQWFHLGSIAMVISLMMHLMIIVLLELPMRTAHQKIQIFSLLVAMMAYGMAGIAYRKEQPFPSIKSEKTDMLKAVFHSIQDRVYIYDSDFSLVEDNERELKGFVGKEKPNLKEYLNGHASVMTAAQERELNDFFQHPKQQQAFNHFKLLIPSYKSYVILSKVFNKDKDWVGTVMLIHQAIDEIELIESIKSHNKRRSDLNHQLDASLKKLDQFGFEKEKDLLLREVNQSIVEGIHQYIQEIQIIQKDPLMNIDEKKERVASLIDGVSSLYKEIRQVVRQMLTKDKVISDD